MEETGELKLWRRMPVVRMFGRKWRFATDDLVFPSVLEMPYRLLWLILLSMVISTEVPASWDCEDAKQGLYIRMYLIGTFLVHLVTMVLFVAGAIESGRGTITDARKPIVPLLMTYIFLEIIEVSVNVIGSVWISSTVIPCPQTTSFAKKVLLSIVIITWLRLVFLLVTTYFLYNSLGALTYERLSPSDHKWYNEKLTKTFVSRLKWALLLVRGDEHSKEAIEEIAKILAILYRSTDLVYSDIVAGCILLAIKEKWVQKCKNTKQSNKHIYCTKMDEVFHESIPKWMNLNDALYYLNLSMAAYGWMFVISKNFCTRLSLIAPFFRCCCQRPEAEVIGDNCCMCHYAGFKYVSQLPDKDIIYISFNNKVYEVPFYVTLLHETKKIVVTIRGTNSLRDVITDLSGKSEIFEVEGLPSGSRAHNGMAKGAEKVMEEILPILKMNFSEKFYPKYGLVVTGHSLGAAIAILLGIKLKPHYPDVKVYAFSAPSGLLTREASEYTKSFVMTVGLGDDVVMRLSLPGMANFRNKLIKALHDTKLPKYRILLKGLSYLFSEIPEQDLTSVWKSPAKVKATLLNSKIDFDKSLPEEFKGTERLYNAGQILHIRHNKDDKSEEAKFTMAWTTPDDFQDLVVMPRMLFDHMTDNVHFAVKTIIDYNKPKRVTTIWQRFFNIFQENGQTTEVEITHMTAESPSEREQN